MKPVLGNSEEQERAHDKQGLVIGTGQCDVKEYDPYLRDMTNLGKSVYVCTLSVTVPTFSVIGPTRGPHQRFVYNHHLFNGLFPRLRCPYNSTSLLLHLGQKERKEPFRNLQYIQPLGGGNFS